MTEKIWVAIISASAAIVVAGINSYASCHRDNARLAVDWKNSSGSGKNKRIAHIL